MKRVKAPGRAAQKSCQPRRGDQLAGRIAAEAKPENFVMQALSIYAGSRCLGFVMPRGRQGYEAFNTIDVSLGLYQTQQAAADAVARGACGAP